MKAAHILFLPADDYRPSRTSLLSSLYCVCLSQVVGSIPWRPPASSSPLITQAQQRELENFNEGNSARFLLRSCLQNVLGKMWGSLELRSLCPAGSSTLLVTLEPKCEGKSYATDIITMPNSAALQTSLHCPIWLKKELGCWWLNFLCLLNRKHGGILMPFIALEISICLNCICA